ncbi:PAXNEB-domain-containing protein [Trametes versicolor FP-101664 SS1]|uniref:PAXNEB-domain-containing protein n=1 Tax=Trametes versicolor (strain FP-101664) TaxID=717944 RepID=UPI0004624913|nr:PAXNEB-domain-containing protein [Trametes versicolor FP-101664 SS1]EIW64418.1 PAXNEB-domain-containing protein [Trametes versicolor FP-101664 SS1]
MSAFKRRTTTKQPPLPAGTRTSPGSTATVITSTGIPSLDDILGGGLPLSCSLLVLAPDAHTAYGELVVKYAAAQGLASGQRVCVVDPRADSFLAECMWMPGSNAPIPTSSVAALSIAADDEDDERASEHDTKIKIAWRYEQMKQFQTTVPSSSQSTDDYCRTFDLTCRIPEAIVDAARSDGRFLDVSPDEDAPKEARRSCTTVIRRLTEMLARSDLETEPLATRICIPALGSYEWGDLTPQDICYFLHSLRALLRRYPRACASVCLAPHLCQEAYGGPGWVQKLGWLTDAAVTLAAFSSNPSLTAMFSSHHGLVHIHTLPSPHTLLPPSDKFSTLRGLSSSGENNLAFKCMRKRLIFETLHLDVEGGVGERRTTPSANAIAMDSGLAHDHTHEESAAFTKGSTSIAAVQVQLEQTQIAVAPPQHDIAPPTEPPTSSFKKVKVKKKVAFHSERPDLYDF